MTFTDKLKELRGAVENPASNPIDRFRNLQTLDAFLANHAAEIYALVEKTDRLIAYIGAHGEISRNKINEIQIIDDVLDALAALEYGEGAE